MVISTIVMSQILNILKLKAKKIKGKFNQKPKQAQTEINFLRRGNLIFILEFTKFTKI